MLVSRSVDTISYCHQAVANSRCRLRRSSRSQRRSRACRESGRDCLRWMVVANLAQDCDCDRSFIPFRHQIRKFPTKFRPTGQILYIVSSCSSGAMLHCVLSSLSSVPITNNSDLYTVLTTDSMCTWSNSPVVAASRGTMDSHTSVSLVALHNGEVPEIGCTESEKDTVNEAISYDRDPAGKLSPMTLILACTSIWLPERSSMQQFSSATVPFNNPHNIVAFSRCYVELLTFKFCASRVLSISLTSTKSRHAFSEAMITGGLHPDSICVTFDNLVQ